MITSTKMFGLVSAIIASSSLYSAENLYADNVSSRLLDADRDGVIDARDLCPDTPNKSAVNNDGCTNEITKLLSVELNILFDSGKADINPQFYGELTELANFLKSNPSSTVVIEGHTDSNGSAELNRELSQKRALSIADILINSFKISSDRVEGVGYGETRPIASNDSDTGRKQNRRVVAEVFTKQRQVNERWTIYSVDQNRN